MRPFVLLLATAGLVTGCDKDGPKAPTSRDGVVEAWKKGGLDPSELTPAKSDIGTDCASGTVNKLDVLVCTFPSAKDAKVAEDSGLEWVGNHTGASKALGEVLIVVADRKKADPSGRTINQLITLPAQ